MKAARLLVKRSDITVCRLAERDPPAIGDGEVLAEVGDFAMTANNVTYAHVGEMIGYWKFFPEDEVWGVVPVWGFTRIIESRVAEVPVGDVIWGFLPMASHVVMRPEEVGPRRFVDASPHRVGLPAVYNDYQRTSDDPPDLRAIADARSLYFPLFTTSFVLADYIADKQHFGAAQVLVGSASSKTGFGLAHYLKASKAPPRVVGLTSAGNVDFVRGLGMYDDVVAYGGLSALNGAARTIYVDMSGDGAILAAVHHHFGDKLAASIGVGATHWEAPRERDPLPGAAPEFFFAPTQIAKRNAEWGPGVLMRRAQDANIALIARLGGHVNVRHCRGAAAVEACYRALVAGETAPSEALVASFQS